MEAFPHMSTIDYFVDNDADKYPQSQVLDFHNKADGHERRLATYLVENLRMATDLEVGRVFGLLDKENTLTPCLDIHIPDSSSSGRDYDVRISWVAPTMGR
jgi:hypothetical protein